MARSLPSKHRQILLVVVLGGFFSLLYFFSFTRFQSFKFADEDEHLVPAYEMVNRGKILYRDLSTNHQPVPIYVAALRLKLLPADNLYMHVERTRQFMFGLAFLGALFLTLRFGLAGLVAATAMELIKFYLFGNYMLAESLIAYPVMIIGGLLGKPLSNRDVLILGIIFPFIAFSLLPAWPFLGVVFIVLFKNIWRYKWYFFLPVTTLTLTVFVGSDLVGWVRETVVNNSLYFLPYDQGADIWSILIFPVRAFLHLNEPVARYYAISFLALALLRPRISVWVMVLLLNLRVPNPGVSFYGGFHLVPQMAFLTMVVGTAPKRILWIWFILVVVGSSAWVLESRNFDKANDHFVSYGESESIGLAISAIKNPGDTLLAGPQDSLVNLAADVSLATRQTAYLDWAYRVPQLRQEFDTMLALAPPTFVYFKPSENNFYKLLQPVLTKNYTRISRTFGGLTDLYIRSDKIAVRTNNQWQKFAYLMYQPPSENED